MIKKMFIGSPNLKFQPIASSDIDFRFLVVI